MLYQLLACLFTTGASWASAVRRELAPLTIDLIRDEADFDPASHLAEELCLQNRYSKFINTNNSTVVAGFIGQVQNRVYYGNLGIGSMGKLLITVFDTGSADVWIASATCGTTAYPLCTNRTTYNSSLSADYVPIGDPIQLNYAGGSVSGFLSEDTMRMAGVTFNNATFIEATDATPGITAIPMSCLFGLGWPDLAAIKNYPTPLQQFFDAVPFLGGHYFTFHLRTDSNAGQMMFGALDGGAFTGEIQYFPAELRPYWGVSMGLTNFADRIFTSTNEMAIVDTGTSLLYMPDAHYQQFAKCIGTNSTFGYIIPCDRVANLPDLIISIGPGNSPFPLRPDQYIFKDKDGKCRSGIRGIASNGGSPLWVLGCVFLRAYYSVFDFDTGEIGFAASVP